MRRLRRPQPQLTARLNTSDTGLPLLLALTLASTGALALTSACGGDDPEPIRGAADVNVVHYDYQFDLATRAASVALTLKLSTAGNCFDLPVRATGFDTVTISSSASDGEQLPALAQVADSQVTACGDGWSADETIVFRATGTVAEETVQDSQVGYSTTLDIEGNPYTYLVSWVGGCDQFGPCQSDPDRFANYTFRVTHPEGTTVLCSGDITETATETTCDFTSAGGPTYSTFGFMASPSWQKVSLGTWGPADVTLYDFPTANLAADIDPQVHSDFIDFMEENFGPYPYGTELRLAAGPTYWNGFEHPGNISLSERLNVIQSLYANPLEHTINHELAHMWAGDQTTLASTYDFVWKEAMAEYLTFVFTEERANAADALQTARAWKQFSGVAAYYPVPAERPPLLDYYGDVYGPGPLILFRHIEAIFDRDSVMTALRSLLGSERAIGVADIQAALEASTGADLDNYFATWVYGEGPPKRPRFSTVFSDVGGGNVDVTVVQENADVGLFGCAFAVRLRGAEVGQEQDVWFNLGLEGAAQTTITATPGFAVQSFIFDPMGHCLAVQVPPGARTAPLAPPAPRFNPWVVGSHAALSL